MERGHSSGTKIKYIACHHCPYGADCSRNIQIENGFYGFIDPKNSTKLRCTPCPSDYCCKLDTKAPPSQYNGCCGQREGALCGRCKYGFVESFLGTSCQPSKPYDTALLFALLTSLTLLASLFIYFTQKLIDFVSSHFAGPCTNVSTGVKEQNEDEKSAIIMIVSVYQTLYRIVGVTELSSISNMFGLSYLKDLISLIFVQVNFGHATAGSYDKVLPGVQNSLFKISIAPIFCLLMIGWMVVITVVVKAFQKCKSDRNDSSDSNNIVNSNEDNNTLLS